MFKCYLLTGVQVFDSISDDSISDNTICQICSIVRTPRKSIKIELINVCKQSGIKDCGLYAIAYATTLCDGEMPHMKLHSKRIEKPPALLFTKINTITISISASPFGAWSSYKEENVCYCPLQLSSTRNSNH